MYRLVIIRVFVVLLPLRGSSIRSLETAWRSAKGNPILVNRGPASRPWRVAATKPLSTEWECKDINTCEECAGVSQSKGGLCHWLHQPGRCRSVAESDLPPKGKERYTHRGPTTNRSLCNLARNGTDPEKYASEFIQRLVRFGELGRRDIQKMTDVFKEARSLLMQEMMDRELEYFVTEVDAKDEADVFIFGDVHGSLWSLVPILRGLLYGIGGPQDANGKKAGKGNLRKQRGKNSNDGACDDKDIGNGACSIIRCKPDTHYLFLGDYVDRGEKMLHVAVLVMSLKLLCPTSVTLLRGNHESPEINAEYGLLEILRNWDGFPKELDFVWPVRKETDPPAIVNMLDNEHVMTKSGGGLKLWYEINKAFSALPVSALVKGRVWCMHGGPNKGGLTTLRSTPVRPMPKLATECDDDTSPLCQLMWNDVVEDDVDFEFNEVRYTAFRFGETALRKILQTDGLEMIIRGHDYNLQGVSEQGYQCMFNNIICTLFSAAQYQANEARPASCKNRECTDEEWMNENPGVVMWLHTPKKKTFFRLREGVMLRRPMWMRPDQTGKTVCTVVSFKGRVLRHVSQSLGCRNCLSHVDKSKWKYHTPRYPSGKVSRLVRNHWAKRRLSKKRESRGSRDSSTRGSRDSERANASGQGI